MLIKTLTSFKAYRCHRCGWRGWLIKDDSATRHSKVVRRVVRAGITFFLIAVVALVALYVVSSA